VSYFAGGIVAHLIADDATRCLLSDNVARELCDELVSTILISACVQIMSETEFRTDLEFKSGFEGLEKFEILLEPVERPTEADLKLTKPCLVTEMFWRQENQLVLWYNILISCGSTSLEFWKENALILSWTIGAGSVFWTLLHVMLIF